MINSRFDRQVLAFGKEGQEKIEKVRVAIVGLGGIGSQVAQGLAYLGTKSFVLVDEDFVETTNLNRLIGATPADAEMRTPKVDVAERNIHQIEPQVDVLKVPNNLRSREALDSIISSDVVFGCVDRDAPRLILMELASAYEVTLIDCATEIIPKDGMISGFGGRVVVARPGDFCLDCANEIDKEVAKIELESCEVRERRNAHGYGLGQEGEAASVVSLNGVIANLAVSEFLVMAAGMREPNRYLAYHGIRGIVNVRDDHRREDCYICVYLRGKRENADLYRYVFAKENRE